MWLELTSESKLRLASLEEKASEFSGKLVIDFVPFDLFSNKARRVRARNSIVEVEAITN